MLKNKNTEDYILITFAVLGIIIIILTIFNFAFHSHVSFFGNIDNDKLSAFSGFIGGIVGTIFSATATILVWMALKTQQKDLAETKKLTQLQIDLSIKPDIYLADFNITFDLAVDKNAHHFTYKDAEENKDPKLVNVGFGAATSISYKWEYDIEECFKATDFPKYIVIENRGIRNYINFAGKKGIFFVPEKNQNIDFLITCKDFNDGAKINSPYEYLHAYSVLEGANYKNFPPLKLHTEYNDITGNRHSKSFKISIALNSKDISVKSGSMLTYSHREQLLAIKYPNKSYTFKGSSLEIKD